MEVKEGGMVIIKGDNIENGGLKIVKNYGGENGGNTKNKPLTEEELIKKINFVKGKITANRLWFSVCKYMMWHKMVSEGDFNGAVSILERLYTGLKLDAKDMSSLNVLCFRKGLEEWEDSSAPVHGATFNKYYTIAELLDAI